MLFMKCFVFATFDYEKRSPKISIVCVVKSIHLIPQTRLPF